MYQNEYGIINPKSIDTLRSQAYVNEYQNQAKLANSPATHDYKMWFTRSLLNRSTLFQNADSLDKLYRLSMEELFSEEFKNLVIFDLRRDISGLYTSIDEVRNLGPIGTYDFFASMVGAIGAKYIPTFTPLNYDYLTDESLRFNVSYEEKKNLILNRSEAVANGNTQYATKYNYTPLTIGELEAGPQRGVTYASKRTDVTVDYVPLSMNIIQKLVQYAENSTNPDNSYVEPLFPGAGEIYVREYTNTRFRYLPLSQRELAAGPQQGVTYYTKPVNTTAEYVQAPYSEAYTCYIREYDNIEYTYTRLSCIDAALGPKKGMQYFTRINRVVDHYNVAQISETPAADAELYYKEFDKITYIRNPLTAEEIAAGPVAGTVYSYEEELPPTPLYVKVNQYEAGTEYYELNPVNNEYHLTTNFAVSDEYQLVENTADHMANRYDPSKTYYVKNGNDYVEARTNAEKKTLVGYAHLTQEEIAAGPVVGETYVFPKILHIGEVHEEERADGPNPDIDYYELSDNSTPVFVGKLESFDPDKNYTWFETNEEEYQDVTDLIAQYGTFGFDTSKLMVAVYSKGLDPNQVDFYIEVKYAKTTEPFDPSKSYFVLDGTTYVQATEADFAKPDVYTEVDKGEVSEPDPSTVYYKAADGAYVECQDSDFSQEPVDTYEAVDTATVTEPGADTTYFKEVDGTYTECEDSDFTEASENVYTEDSAAFNPDATYYKNVDGAYVECADEDFDKTNEDVFDPVDTTAVTEPDPDTTYFRNSDGSYSECIEDDFGTVNNEYYEVVDTTTVTEPDPDTTYYKNVDGTYTGCEESDFDIVSNDAYDLVDTATVTEPDPDTTYYKNVDGAYVACEEGDFDTSGDVKAWTADAEYYTKTTTTEKNWKSDVNYFTFVPGTNKPAWLEGVNYFTKRTVEVVSKKADFTYYLKTVTTRKTWTAGLTYYTKTTSSKTVWSPDTVYYTKSVGEKTFKPDVDYFVYDGYDLWFKENVEYYTFETGVVRFKPDVDYYVKTMVENGTHLVDNANLTAFDPNVVYFKRLIDYINSTRTGNYIRLDVSKFDPNETYYTKTSTTEPTDEFEEFFGTVAFNPDVIYYTRTADYANSTLSQRYTPYTGPYDPNQTYYKLLITETDSVYDILTDHERADGPIPGVTYYTKAVQATVTYVEVPANEIAIHIAAGQLAGVSETQPTEYYIKVGNAYELYSGEFSSEVTYYTKHVEIEELDEYIAHPNLTEFDPETTYYYEVSLNSDGYVEKHNVEAFASNKVYYVKAVDPNNSAMGENYVPYTGKSFNDYPEFYTKSVHVEEHDDYVNYTDLTAFNPHIIYYHSALDVERTVLTAAELATVKKTHTIEKLNAYHDVYIRDALATVKEIMSKHSLHVIISSVNLEADNYDRAIANTMYIKFLNVFAYFAFIINNSKNLDDTCKGYKLVNDIINIGLKDAKSIADMFSTANYVSKIVLESLLPDSIKAAVFQHYDICSPVCDNVSCSPNLTQSFVTENMVENMIKLRNLLDNVDIATETDENLLVALFIMAYNIFIQIFFYSAFNSRNKVQVVKAVSTLLKTFTPSFDQVISANELKGFIELGDDK